jgi:hypothetical protein
MCHNAAYAMDLIVSVIGWQRRQYPNAEQGDALGLCGVIIEALQTNHGVGVLQSSTYNTRCRKMHQKR